MRLYIATESPNLCFFPASASLHGCGGPLGETSTVHIQSSVSEWRDRWIGELDPKTETHRNNLPGSKRDCGYVFTALISYISGGQVSCLYILFLFIFFSAWSLDTKVTLLKYQSILNQCLYFVALLTGNMFLTNGQESISHHLLRTNRICFT